MTRTSRSCLCLALLTMVACGEEEEVLVRNPGRLEAVVVLEGHPVPCADGAPAGQLVIELYPWGDMLEVFRDGPAQVHVLPASEVFGPSDCGEGPRTASAALTLEDVGPPAGATTGREYLVRAIYDRDGDYRTDPAVFRTPTRGDLVGGVLEALGPEGTPWSWIPVAFEASAEHPEGQVVSGVTVLLGLEVSHEPPAARLRLTGPLSSEAVVPLVSDSLAREQMLFDLLGASLDRLGPLALDQLAEAGLDLDREPEAQAWNVMEFDADGDGAGDPHPMFAALGFPLLTPVVVFERRRTEAERGAGIPPVRLVASIRPSQVISKQVFFPRMDLLVPPLAEMELSDDPLCTIPVVPPGNAASSYMRVPVTCQELPTGAYDARILHGRAGATRQTDVPSFVSDVGVSWSGGRFAGQTWTVPNGLYVAGQGDHLTVVDPDVDSVSRCDEAIDDSGVEPPAPRPIEIMPVPTHCCAAIEHLCGLPLCAPTGAEGGSVRALTEPGGGGAPPCVPFPMPASCCE